MDKNNTPLNKFLDLSKGFDTLYHKILLEMLNYYSIIGVAYRLMESYITNGKQYVDIDDVQSEMLTVTTRVPQGSILGPLLFIIYLNDIAHTSNLFNFIIYADHTTLSTAIDVIKCPVLTEALPKNRFSSLTKWILGWALKYYIFGWDSWPNILGRSEFSQCGKVMTFKTLNIFSQSHMKSDKISKDLIKWNKNILK